MKYYTEQEIEFIRQNYLELTSREISERLGRTESSVAQKLFVLKLRRPIRSQFKPGHVPWNKNRRSIHVSPATEFKSSHVPSRTKYDGAITIRLHRRSGKSYKFIRINQNKWKTYHSYLWEQVNGKIPAGCILRFKNGDSLDVRIENLMLVNRGQHLRMNSNPAKTGKQYWWQNGGEGHLNSDKYIALTLEPFDAAMQREYLNHPELIELKRYQLKLKRAININGITKK